MSQNIIQQSIEDPVRLSKNLPEFLDLNFRGRPMSIPRDTLINFPETILADMFPDGCLQEYVDMDYACIEYLMTFYHNHSSFLVLREALEYYCIPLTSDGNMIKYKKEAGKYLQAQNVVFDPLFMKNDQHLINMLCYTGFNKNDIWGYRQLEANHTNLLSLRSLVLSKGIAQKLQMLYKRAARKCWWHGITVQEYKLWTRHTWTLELVQIN
ncbi:hypothetical protein BDB01DRAFT_751320 [Pilobolus umbonatus]|nr:hypothetical protein BDB01DRAFT_751320 [Pilobolus umbonatus]